jgi:hypothetical protein
LHPRRVVEVLAGTIYSDGIAVTEQPLEQLRDAA